MDNPRIIHAPMNGRRFAVTSPITQYDYGYLLLPEGMELPATYEIDFSNDEKNGTSLTVYGGAEGAEVPEELIRTGKDVYAFYYRVGEGYGKTEFTWKLPNKCRPSRDGETPTPSQQSSIDQLITRSNEAVERAEDAQQAIEDMSVSATTLAEGESATVTKTEQEGVVHLEFGIPVGATGEQGERGEKGDKGDRGEQGIQGIQGERGLTGQDGISPTVTITPITGGHRITITDADGEHSADVMDGTGNVDDVQINGTSIVEDGVADIPTASASILGVVQASSSNGIYVNSNGVASISEATFANVKTGTNVYKPITPHIEHGATFYGLAKSAGDTTQSQSSNAVGTYTEEAKIAIQKMLGIYEAPWELIREDTFTNAEEADLVISTDANGEGFELTDAFIIFLTPRQDTVAKVGNYGQTIFNLSNNDFVFTESGQWENAANTTVKGFAAQAKVDGNLITSMSTQSQSASSPSAWRSRWNITNGFRFYNNVSITSVTIRAITGTAKYTLYGKRKWQ